MNVLSLFDGMSAGRIALERAGIPVNQYYASEIDKHAIKVSKDNWTDVVHIGDVTKVSYKDGVLHTENGEFNVGNIDLVIGGSPCQSFSSIGKGEGFDGKSGLFYEFLRLLCETNPKNFLLENVKMMHEHRNVISRKLGVEPHEINSALFSAQNRKRLYWSNINYITDIRDKGIELKDVIDHSITEARIPKNFIKRVPLSLPEYVDPYNKKELFNKSTTLRTNVNNGNMWVKVQDYYRNLTVRECELLQTVDIGYTSCVSDNQAKKQLGNGWTVDVIAHILKGIKDDATN